jgi:hypothetical protein
MSEKEKIVREMVEAVGGRVSARKLRPCDGGCWDIALFAPDGMTWDGEESEFVCTSWLIAHSRIRRAIEKLGGPLPIITGKCDDAV